MPKKQQHPCFHCGEPSTQSIQSRTIKARKYICRDKRCWDTYYRLADQAAKEKK